MYNKDSMTCTSLKTSMSYLNNKYINKVEPHKLISKEDDDFVIDFN